MSDPIVLRTSKSCVYVCSGILLAALILICCFGVAMLLDGHHGGLFVILFFLLLFPAVICALMKYEIVLGCDQFVVKGLLGTRSFHYSDIISAKVSGYFFFIPVFIGSVPALIPILNVLIRLSGCNGKTSSVSLGCLSMSDQSFLLWFLSEKMPSKPEISKFAGKFFKVRYPTDAEIAAAKTKYGFS